MRHGDRDGFKVIYDHNGQLILHTDEKKLVVEENVIPTLKSTWRYYGGEYLLEPSKGTMVLTSERLVFINTPERMFAIGGGEEARAMETASDKTFEIGEGAQGGALREYFEVPNIEIMASERKEGAVSVGEMVNVYILSTGNQFHLSMVLPKESGLLSRLMNKKVQSLDELVNNLKELFKQTDWMYTEQERRIMVATAPTPPSTQDPQRQPVQSVPNIPGVRAAPAASKPQVSQPSSSPGPRVRPIIDEKGSRQSLAYFENLYKKGLIKEEVYKRLIEQIKVQGPAKLGDEGGAKAAPFPSGTLRTGASSLRNGLPPDQRMEGLEAPMDGELVVISPEPPPEHSDKSDDELLSMLNNTLIDLGEETGATDNTNKARPVPKRVLRTVPNRN